MIGKGRRMALHLAIKHREHFHRPGEQSRLLLDLAHHRLGRGVVHLRPPPRQRPAPAIRQFLHQQDLMILEHYAANIHFRGGVAKVTRVIPQQFTQREIAPGGHHLSRNLAHARVASVVIAILRVSEAGLTHRLYLAGPGQHLRFGGFNHARKNLPEPPPKVRARNLVWPQTNGTGTSHWTPSGQVRDLRLILRAGKTLQCQ